MKQSETGTVYLVGAGPGNPELITVRGLMLLRSAPVVVHDRLVHQDLLDQANDSAEIISVGKIPGRVTVTQDEINILLVEKASQGLDVVRLKGGDPFVFGRGGEEARALSRARIAFEVVPGVTSAIAAPAFAGIPILYRGVARNFAVVTGHFDDPEEEPDWSALVRLDTLVVLMGLGRLPTITRRLIDHGLNRGTPVAVIGSGTVDAQRVVTGTLTDIVHRAARLDAPAVIVVGNVVRQRALLDWFRPAAPHSNSFPLEATLTR